ncbi:hypothetical protein [Cellulomonas sp. IC4_254]|uniref:hypothetical protein n=1 Tax=Cellulomonas sp. IC4_254 TaxID=2714040 RepID=UPI0014204E77|nr:hypothetical protein [Cellulomonas sp. IC4_254]NHT18738.1 hypothetical protein [Cellulomonas sp. IC4_254]
MLTFMHAFGTTKWEELRRQTTGSGTRRPRYHSHEFDEVRPEAQERLSTLGHDLVFERLVRYRTSGKGRAWGFEVDGVFYLLWWDTEHAVYPVSRK